MYENNLNDEKLIAKKGKSLVREAVECVYSQHTGSHLGCQ